MNRFFPWSSLSLAFLLLASSGCALMPQNPATIVGTWKNGLGTRWTLRPDGTFAADLNHDGKEDVLGRYSLNGDIITIAATQGQVPKFCDQPGVYSFELKGNILHFSPIKDKCRLRASNILLTWHRQ
jgi:hypothetical protein